jgi:hypothetical protein
MVKVTFLVELGGIIPEAGEAVIHQGKLPMLHCLFSPPEFMISLLKVSDWPLSFSKVNSPH